MVEISVQIVVQNYKILKIVIWDTNMNESVRIKEGSKAKEEINRMI